MKTYLLLSLLTLLGAPVLASKFTVSNACITNSGALIVDGSLAGAGQQSLITLSGTLKAECHCVTKGGTTPKAGNKNSVSNPVSASGTFCAPTQGSGIPFCLMAGPPSPSCESGLHCGQGQTAMTTFTYTNVRLTSSGGTAKTSIGTVTQTCPQTLQNCQGTAGSCS